MAKYKQREHVMHSNDAVFDIRRAPGTEVENPGIYRCRACGDEILMAKGRLPSHRHERGEGEAEWQLLVLAEPLK